MLFTIIVSIAAIIGGYFTIRYLLLLYAFKQISRELKDIQQDLSQNQIVHLPIPDKSLSKLLSVFNSIIEEIRKERQTYERRERDFQKQIENISHDLRTPLTVILGYLKLLNQPGQNNLKKNQELQETIEIIKHKSEIMKNLVNQFYDYSRLKAGDFELQLDRVDISRMLREALMGSYQILEEAHLEITVDIPEHPVWILGAEASLERIFSNLFQNAGRYADSFLHISLKEEEEAVSISFMNDTKTLSSDDISHLFERFYMQDQTRNQGGTGLGLTVAKLLAEETGGSLKAHEVPSDMEETNADAPNTLNICFELSMKAISSQKF